MKKRLSAILCLCLAVVMVFCIAGCGGTKNKLIDTETEDFDIEGIMQDIDANTGTDASGANGSGDAKKSGKVTAAAIPGADSLSWKQLVSQMPKELKGTTITVDDWNASKEYTGSEKVMREFEKQTGIKIKWVVTPYDNYTTKIAALINAKNSPDIIRMYTNDPFRMYLCDDVQSATGFDFKGDIWDQRVNKAYTIKGKVYAVHYNNTLFQQPKVFMYHRSVIEKLKLEDPYVVWKNGGWTWDKFTQMCKAYLAASPNGNAWISYNGLDLMSFAGRQLIEYNGTKYVNNQNDQEVVKALQQMCNLSSQNILSKAMRDQKVFQSGNVFMMTFNSIALRRTNSNLMEAKADDDLYCVPIPTIPGREQVQEYSELEASGIPKGAKNPAAVYYYLRYFYDADNYNPDEVFVNKQAYDVYQYCRKKQQVFCNYDSYILVSSTGTESSSNYFGIGNYAPNGGAVAQLKSELDKIKPQIDLATKKANELLAKFK